MADRGFRIADWQTNDGPSNEEAARPHAAQSAIRNPQSAICMTSFGQTPDGRAAQLHRLENGAGFAAEISDYGGTIVRLFAPDRQGKFADVVLGFDAVEAYVAGSPFF